MRKKSLYIVCTIFLFTFLYSCKNEPIYGCIDKNAVNFNSIANTMQDSSCIIIQNKLTTYNKETKKLVFDFHKYANVNYTFIYNNLANDTIKTVEKYNRGKFKRNLTHYYQSYTVYEADTLKFTSKGKVNNLEILNKAEDHNVFLGQVFIDNNVKVIEKINGLNSKTYFIDITCVFQCDDNEKGGGMGFINPRAYFKYKNKTRYYSTTSNSDRNQNSIKKYQGFYIEMRPSPDYWFEKLPYIIRLESWEGSDAYRTSIERY